MKNMEIIITEISIDEKGVGHIGGTANNKKFHISGEDGYHDDAIGNLTDEEYERVLSHYLNQEVLL